MWGTANEVVLDLLSITATFKLTLIAAFEVYHISRRIHCLFINLCLLNTIQSLPES